MTGHMQIKKLWSEDDSAVSPVIGVILMVAITVILAAVIASFVLGLGDTADEVQPTTSFSFDYDEAGNDAVTITVEDGDSIDTNNLWVRGTLSDEDNVDVDATWQEILDDDDVPDDDWEIEGTWSDEEVTSGQSLEIESDGETMADHDFSVVWDTGDDSSTLDSSTGPDA